MLARILLNKLLLLNCFNTIVKPDLVPEGGYTTIDVTFTAWELQETCQEQNVDFYTSLLAHEGFWKIMASTDALANSS